MRELANASLRLRVTGKSVGCELVDPDALGKPLSETG
jgi:hypothetical protein